MPLLLDIQSCDELDPELVDRVFAPSAGSPRDQVLKLVEKMARVAKPGRGAHRILEILARLAQSAWVDGALDVILRDFGLATEIDIRLDAGKHLERLRTVSVAVPLAELADWAGANPDALAPLVVFDTRRDDELRLRKASGRVTQIPRSTVPLAQPSAPRQSSRPAAPPNSTRPSQPPNSTRPRAGAVPSSHPPASSGRRPIAAATRRSSIPAQPAAPAVSEREAELQARRTLPDLDGLEARAAGSRGPDVHRRDTPRVVKVDLPEEAYRPQSAKVERKSTARIPAVRPASTALGPETDPTDEGWE